MIRFKINICILRRCVHIKPAFSDKTKAALNSSGLNIIKKEKMKKLIVLKGL